MRVSGSPSLACHELTDVTYRWGSSNAEPFTTLPSYGEEPPHRDGRNELRVRGVIPELHAIDPAIQLSRPFARSLVIADRTVDGLPALPTVFPLAPNDAGKSGEFVITSNAGGALIAGHACVGSQREMVAGELRHEIVPFGISATLVLAGFLLLAGSFTRRAIREYRMVGLLLLPVGITIMRETTLLAATVVPSAEGWRIASGFASFVWPIGLGLFVREIFGDTRRNVLRVATSALAAFLAVAVVLHITALVPVYATRLPLPLIAVFIAIVSVRVLVAQRHMRTARIFLVGFVALVGLSLPDLLAIFGILLLGFQTAPFGFLAFGVSLVLVIQNRDREKTVALETSRTELSRRIDELETHRREIEGLNEELRYRVEARSRELREAFSDTTTGQFVPVLKTVREGDLVAERYRIVRLLGEGAMGAVHEVQRTSDDKRFALKVMSGEMTQTAAARFAREAETAASVRHENLVTVVDVGLDHSRTPFIVMELINGRSLEHAQSRYGDVPWALSILRDIAAGLAALHKAGIVHRDLKPANILLEPHGVTGERAKIGDFGIARALSGDDDPSGTTAPMGAIGGTDAALDATVPVGGGGAAAAVASAGSLTRTGLQMGTPLYMAPESASGGTNLTFAADVFSFGLIAFEIMNARRPFEPAAIILAMGRQPIAPPTWPAHAAAPDAVLSMLQKTLAVDMNTRPTADDLAALLASTP